MDINAGEIALLILIGILFFGPEKLPEYARKAARIVKYLRGIANNAQSTLREQLGPEYADLQLADLHPKNMVRKVLTEDYDDVRREIESLPDDLRLTGASGAGATVAGRAPSRRAGEPVRYDDAT